MVGRALGSRAQRPARGRRADACRPLSDLGRRGQVARRRPRGFLPEPQLRRLHHHLHDDGRRPERGRRLRRPARSRLRRVLRGRRLRGGLAGLPPVQPDHVSPRLGRSLRRAAGYPPLDLADPDPCRYLHRRRRHRDRPSDPPLARGLPRDRHARLRRDRAAVRAQRRQSRAASTSRTGRSASRPSTRRASARRCTTRSACPCRSSSRSTARSSSSGRRSP